MTSKARKRSQAGRRDQDTPSNLTESGRKEPGDAPSPIAPNQSSKMKSAHSPSISRLPHPDDSDSDDQTDGKAHLGKNKRPDLIGTRPCERFLSGHCNFGKDCWFVHDVEARDQARAAAATLNTANSGSSQMKVEEEGPPKPKISLAPTNPWGRPLPEDEENDSPDISNHSEAVSTDSSLGLSQNLPHSIDGQSTSSRNAVSSSLLPATPVTQPALGVFSVVDMLANVRSGLFQDAISRGVACVAGNPAES